jgi:hypothetical protein
LNAPVQAIVDENENAISDVAQIPNRMSTAPARDAILIEGLELSAHICVPPGEREVGSVARQ